MKISYNVSIPEKEFGKRKKRQKPEYYKIRNFLSSSNENMSFEYRDNREALNRAQALRVWVRDERIPVSIVKRGNIVVVTRKEAMPDAWNDQKDA